MKTYLPKSVITLSLCVLFVFTALHKVYAAEEDVAKFPTHPITFISPMAPGTTTDVAIRLIAKEAEKFLGQPVVVLNKSGGAHTLGTEATASAKPDGYTVGHLATTPLLISPFIEKLPYDPLKDFQYIMQFGNMDYGVVVKGDSPFKTFKELIEFARQNPKKVIFGTAGPTSIFWLAVSQIAKQEGVQFTPIPFKGSSETSAALLGGHITASTGGFILPQVEAGQTRLLLLFAEEQRAPYPGVPILKDLGYYFPCPFFLNVSGPKGIPPEIAKKLEDAFTKAMKEPAFIKGMEDIKFPIVYRNSKELTEYIGQNLEFFPKVLKEMGLRK